MLGSLVSYFAARLSQLPSCPGRVRRRGHTDRGAAAGRHGADARPGARPQRKRKAVDYAAVNEGVEKVGLASRWIPHLERTKEEFLDGAALGAARLATGTELNDAWARKTDMRTPAIIASTEGLGMTLPEPHFMVRDVAKVIGEEKPVQVMRSRDQTNLDHWPSRLEPLL